MNPFRWGAAALVALGVAISATVYFRSSREIQTAPSSSQRDVPRLDGKWIRFSSEFAKRSSVAFAACTEGTLMPVVSVTGTVTFDPQRVAALGSRIAGRVRRVAKEQGDPVRAGDVIVEIESADVGAAQAAVTAARAKVDAAVANEARQQALAEQHAATIREMELAREAASVARAELAAADQRLKAMGTATSPGVIALASPIEGKVVEIEASRGQYVEPTFTVGRVASLDTVWIELDVFERELLHVHAGDAVEISPQSNQALVREGHVARVGDVIDKETRSAPVRVVVDNDGSLRPGQSVVAKIRTARTTSKELLAPIDAVATVDGKPTVFVAHDETSVEPRVVTLGPRDAQHVVISGGLVAGERIVVSGVFALKSEVFR
jgi:cobalt-zinc-cadmium efflux system membrane fusion protein